MNIEHEIWEAILKYGHEIVKAEPYQSCQIIDILWGEKDISFSELSEWVINNEDPLYAPIWSVPHQARKKEARLTLNVDSHITPILQIIIWTTFSDTSQGYIYQNIFYQGAYSEGLAEQLSRFNFQGEKLCTKKISSNTSCLEITFFDKCILYFAAMFANFRH